MLPIIASDMHTIISTAGADQAKTNSINGWSYSITQLILFTPTHILDISYWAFKEAVGGPIAHYGIDFFQDR